MANIKNLSVLPRPRSAWQAMDAGFSLARAHYIKLVILWLGFSVPVFAICALIQITMGWPAMFFVWWWFKPLYELPIMMYLSKALFSETLSLRAAWALSLSHFGLLFKTYLTLARLSSARALTYSVVFLEMLPRKQRRARIETLTMVPTRHYLLMMVCVNIEIILSYAIIIVFTLLFASDVVSQINWEAIFASSDSPTYQYWLVAATFTSLIGAALVAPFYVAGGFLIYINRRMHLEAWDIEHRFRSIKPRSGVGLAVLVLALVTFGTPEPSVAEDRANLISSRGVTANTLDKILAHEDFGAIKTQKIPKFNLDRDDTEEDSQFLRDLREWLNTATSSLASFIKIVLWVLAVVFILLLLYTIRNFRKPRLASAPLSRAQKDEAGAISHPLTQNLPNDIAAEARRLLEQGERRQALSVLFRGALRAIMDEYELKISKGATESDCKSKVETVANGKQIDSFSKLLQVWQKEAYANQAQPDSLIASLIEDWTHAFSEPSSRSLSSTEPR